MGAGKTTLLCQDVHNRTQAGQTGAVITFGDRSGGDVVTARAGLSCPATAVTAHDDVTGLIPDGTGRRFLAVDEAQFASPAQIDVFAHAVDESGGLLDIVCYGLWTDFTGKLFPGTARLVELADRVERLPLSVWCWCGAPATHNGRVGADGRLATDGPVVAVGDVSDHDGTGPAPGTYVTVCRAHHRNGDAGGTTAVPEPAAGQDGDAPAQDNEANTGCPDVVVRLLTASDVDAAAAVARAAITRDWEGSSSQDLAVVLGQYAARAVWASMIEHSHAVGVVVDGSLRAVGTVHVEGDSVAYIGAMNSLDAQRGYAAAVTATRLVIARALGCRTARAHVDDDNDASIANLTRAGFVDAGPEPAMGPGVRIYTRTLD